MTEIEKEIANEAFMIGRIYATMGEKESPAEIHQKLFKRCERIAKNYHTTANVRFRLLKTIFTQIAKATSYIRKHCRKYFLRRYYDL